MCGVKVKVGDQCKGEDMKLYGAITFLPLLPQCTWDKEGRKMESLFQDRHCSKHFSGITCMHYNSIITIITIMKWGHYYHHPHFTGEEL